MRIKRERTLTGTTQPEEQEYERAHREIARKTADACIVLLKNEGSTLPISPDTPIALFGMGAVCTVKGGTGSGDVNDRRSVSIAEGLRSAGYTLTSEDWLTAAAQTYRKAREEWRSSIWSAWDDAGDDMGTRFAAYSECPFTMPAGGTEISRTSADTALYVLSRVAGEGKDRTASKGDYYLSNEEAGQLDQVCTLYRRVVLILNTGGPVDLSMLDRYRNIAAVLQMSQLGCEGGNALADVLSGAVTPSGKLTATWAAHYRDYPNADSFSSASGDLTREEYREGIYVGYRYFDSFQVAPRFGFGFGLSYTDFALGKCALTVQKSRAGEPDLSLAMTVTNTGGVYSGREIVQVYVSPPQGRLDKEYRRLVTFGKTGELAPGGEEHMTLTFPAYALASYDPALPGWVLEPGIYGIFLGPSLDKAALVGAVLVEGEQVLVKTRNVCPLQQPLEEIRPSHTAVKARRSILEAKARAVPQVTLKSEDFVTREVTYGEERVRISREVRDFVNTLTPDQLVELVTGDPGQGQGSSLGSSGISVPGSAAQTSICAREQGLADLVLADGPAGLRLSKDYCVKDGKILPAPFEKGLEGGYLCLESPTPGGVTYYQYCTAFPVGTALAQSWDRELVRDVGETVAEEMQRFLVTAWLAPGMNIQRNPLCGRNFEYYSEDPVLSGEMAAAMTSGVQSQPGCGTTVKHFACNNQEDNRMGSDSVLGERALREIYLKGFELAVTRAQPHFIMTSYNLVNGVHAANNYDLCTAVARDEWGFTGAIMTDWLTTLNGPDCTASGCMRAGNDLVMPGDPRDHADLRRSLEDGSLDPDILKLAVCHIVRAIWQSNMYEETEGEDAGNGN